MCCKGWCNVKHKDKKAGRTTKSAADPQRGREPVPGDRAPYGLTDPGRVCRVALITAPGPISSDLRRDRQKLLAQALGCDTTLKEGNHGASLVNRGCEPTMDP